MDESIRVNGLLALAAGGGAEHAGSWGGGQYQWLGQRQAAVKEGPHVEPPGCRFLPQKLQVFRTRVCKGR